MADVSLPQRLTAVHGRISAPFRTRTGLSNGQQPLPPQPEAQRAATAARTVPRVVGHSISTGSLRVTLLLAKILAPIRVNTVPAVQRAEAPGRDRGPGKTTSRYPRQGGADAAHLEPGIETISAEQARRAAVSEHRKGMALIAAAQAATVSWKWRLSFSLKWRFRTARARPSTVPNGAIHASTSAKTAIPNCELTAKRI